MIGLVAEQLNLKGADQPLSLDTDRFALIESFTIDADDHTRIETFQRLGLDSDRITRG